MKRDRPESALAAPRRLTKRDLDRRIEALLAEVTTAGNESDAEEQDLRPRPISPAALVALVRPLLSSN